MSVLTMNANERFWSKVEKTDFCWNWTATTSSGYGTFKINKKTNLSHRLSYEDFYGKIPKGLQIDHLCRNKRCVNPEHLEAVTSRENTMRGNNITAVNARKTHCKYGHKFTEENTYLFDSKEGKKRCCRICRRISSLKINHWGKREMRTK